MPCFLYIDRGASQLDGMSVLIHEGESSHTSTDDDDNGGLVTVERHL